MSAPLMVFSGLRKSFGARQLFAIERLAIEEGRTYVVTGANGSGKTTLLRIVAGLDPAQAGELRFRGAVVGGAAERDRVRRSVAYVHQHPYLFHTSLEHNFEYGLRCRGLPADERARLVEDAFAWSGLSARRRTPPAALSGGEKQRAALARARALRPELLLLDEPTSNLDEQGRAQTLELLAQLRDERRTVIVACHDREVIALEGVTRLRLEGGALG
jgi:tungstate transport system ATP-binding protein